MKKISILIVLTLLTVLNSSAQSEEELIQTIREQFKTTNLNINAYESIEKDIPDESTEGAVIKIYHENGETVYMHCKFYGETGNITEDYYYHNGSLYFVFTVRETYNQPIYIDGSEVESKEENRYYFHEKKLIRWLDKDKQKVNSYTDAFKEAEEKTLNESLRLIEVFNNN